jgi:hypothetical protein
MDDINELFRRLIAWLTQKTIYYGFYRYRVIEQLGDTVSLQAVGDVNGLKDQLRLPKMHGFSSVKEDLKPASLVLVGFEGGNPGAPFIAHYFPGPPIATNITIDSSDLYTVNSGDITETAKGTAQFFAGDRAEIGGPTLVPAADGDLSDENLGKLWLKVNALCTAVGIPPVSPMKSVGSEKVFITASKGTAIDPH